MKCPHCTVEFHGKVTMRSIDQGWRMSIVVCPKCYEHTVHVERGVVQDKPEKPIKPEKIVPPVEVITVYPPPGDRQIAQEVPAEIATDFREACRVLPASPKASAALSRRCLQHVFHSMGNRGANLASEIDAAVVSPGFPSTLAEMLHAVRRVGNVAAHPKKETSTGAILDVEPGEAELLLDVLEDVFDHYFVKPERNRQRLAVIQAKLSPPPPTGTP